MADNNNPQDFAEKVLLSLKKQSRAVDLSEPNTESQITSEDPIAFRQQDFQAFGSLQQGGAGPASGGNKDLVIVPGYGGSAASSVSQVNFYWNAPAVPDSTGVDANVRATIYNFAVNPGSGVTHPVLVFGGYDGTNQYKPQPSYGGGAGVTAKVWLNPFLGRIDLDYIGLNTTSVGSTTDTGVISWDTTQQKIRVGSAGIAKTLAYTDDIPSISGFANTAYSVNTVSAATNAAHYLTFSPLNGGSGVAISSDAELTYNPSTNILTANTFSGSLSGTATTATNISLAAGANNASHSVVFSLFSAGSGIALSSDAELTYNPSTNTLTATTFSGAFSGNVTGNLTGTATTATNVNVAAGANNASHSLIFSLVATGAGVALSSDGQLTYNPSTDTLSATNVSATFSGNLTGNVTGNSATATTSANINVANAATSAAHYLHFSPFATGSGLATSSDTDLSYNPSTNVLTVPTVSATLTGNVTGNLTGFATTAYNVNSVSAATSATHYLLFSPVNGGSGIAVSSDSTLIYNPSTDVLTATQFTGTLSGYATTATNVNVVNATTNANHFITFSPVQTGSGVALSSDTSLYWNPSTDTLYATNIVGTVTGTIAGIAQTAANLNVAATTTNATHYILMSQLATGGGVAVSSDSTFTINPSTNALSVGSGSVTANSVRIGNSASTIDTSAGNLTLDSTGGQTNINDNVVISGNLTVQGSTITVDSTVSTIVDPVIVIGSGVGGTHSTLDNNQDRGIEFRWSNAGTATTGFFGFNDTDGKFRFIPNASITSTNVYSGTVGTAVFATVEAALSGNASGTAATYTNFYGTLNGSVAGTATTATNVYISAGANNANHALVFSLNATGAGVALSTDAQLLYNPSTDTLTATSISAALTGNVTGTATTATNLHVANANAASAHYIHFSPVATGTGIATSTDTDLSYNPSTNVLTVSSVSANVTGNLTGNVTGTATTATNVNVAAGANNASHSILFSLAATGAGVALSSDTQLTYNPSTDTLSATNVSATFSGNLTGNVTGNVTGFAGTAYNVNSVSAATNASHFLLFSPVNGGSGVAVSSDAQLTYNPSTDTLSATNMSATFSGNVTGNLTGNVTGTATTATNVNVVNASTSAAHYIHFSPVATGTGIATSSDTDLAYNPSTNVLTVPSVSANLTGNVTGNLTGFATTSYNVNAVSAATNATHYVLFAPVNGGSGVAVSSDAQLTYNPSTDTLSATLFSGSFTGNAATATTAANLNVANAAAATSHYLLFSPTQNGSGIAVSSDSTLSYVPSTDTLSVSNISPHNITSSSALTSGTYLTITTAAGDDASTGDYFIRGLTSGSVSKFSIDANGNLRATTKSFDIEHPTKPGMRLVYGVLEGPEHGVYHRGTVEGKGQLMIELPDYWSKLVNEDYTVTLTPYGNYGVHIVEKSLNSFIIAVSGNPLTKKFKHIKVDYLVHGSRKDAPLIIEQPE